MSKRSSKGLGRVNKARREDWALWMERLSALVAPRSRNSRWAITAGALVAGVGTRIVLADWLEQVPFLSLFPAVFMTALLCGWREGAVVLVLAAIAAWLLFLPDVGTVQVAANSPIVPLLGFLAIGGPMVVFVAALAELVRRLDTARQVHESLFQELQHRVANNMQFIAAMLHQARRGMGDSPAAEVLDQASARITSMARLNRQLSDPAAYQRGLEPVLRDLLEQAFEGLPVRLRLNIHTKSLSLDQMTVVVLLVSEAATNAVKHVFRPEQGSEFEVALIEGSDHRLQLMIRDDGPGLGPVAVPGPPAQKLGMRIMHALAGQLGGSLQFPDRVGLTLLVEFPRR